jgi:hypothetical protein
MSNNFFVNLIGFIGYALMSYDYYNHRSDIYSNIILVGYILLTLSHIPKTDDHNDKNDKKEHESNTMKLGHIIVSSYYGYKILSHKIDLHSILGLIANSLFLTKYKQYSNILLLIFYTETIFRGHGIMAIYIVSLHYLLLLNKNNYNKISSIISST